MKKYIPIFALSALVFGSCSDFLDVQPEGVPTTDNYFTNDRQAMSAIDGLYGFIHQEDGFGRELFWEQGAACDIVWAKSRNYNTLATFKYTGSEGPLQSTFELFYNTMSRSNWIIKNLLAKEGTKGLTPIEHRSLGEAFFMRGMAHFYIAYRYGTKDQGVPFLRFEDIEGEYDYSIPPQRATVMENYQLIIDDMDKAIHYLPRFEEYGVENQGRAHDAAAIAYQAKVYAYWAMWDESKWDDVIRLVDKLENEYGRDLAPSLDEFFSSDFNNFWNKEYIWSIPSNGGSTGGGTEFPGVILEDKGWGIYNGWGQIKPSLDIYNEMAKDGAGNARLRRSILEYNQEFEFFGKTMNFYSNTNFDVGFQINKYMDPFKYKDAQLIGYVHTNGNMPTARINFPLIRFAEMKLFRAEAYLVKNLPEKAIDDLNDIRERSGLTPLTHNPTMADLYHERRCELAFEFTDHLFDLKRWHMSSNAELKELAAKELNTHPSVRVYEDRSDPKSSFKVEPYVDYPDKAQYQDYMLVFPYPSDQVINSNGKLQQNKGYK